MPFHAGQSYLFPINIDNQRAHLWAIATEPNQDGAFATVSFTSLKGAKDQTVVFRKDEHPFLKWDTCILYQLAEITDTATLQAKLDAASAKMHQDMAPAMLQLILDGFTASDFTKNRVRDFVRQYKLLAKAHKA